MSTTTFSAGCMMQVVVGHALEKNPKNQRVKSGLKKVHGRRKMLNLPAFDLFKQISKNRR
jgi:hypothetical protein